MAHASVRRPLTHCQACRMATYRLGRANDPGICGTCGNETARACAACAEAHFCCAECHDAGSAAHSVECGWPGYAPLLLPPSGLRNPIATIRLKNGGVFALDAKKKMRPPTLMTASALHGVTALTFDAATCAALADVVENSRCEDGYLCIGGQSFPGYETYDSVAAPVVDPYEQSRWTSVLQQRKLGHISHCLAHCPPLKALTEEILLRFGCELDRIKLIHFARQQSPQCQFTWHQDHLDTGLSESMITVVVCLKGSNTGMQMYGFRVFKYSDSAGSGCGFPGAATHRSVYQVVGSGRTRVRSPTVDKVAYFLD